MKQERAEDAVHSLARLATVWMEHLARVAVIEFRVCFCFCLVLGGGFSPCTTTDRFFLTTGLQEHARDTIPMGERHHHPKQQRLLPFAVESGERKQGLISGAGISTNIDLFLLH